MSDDTTMNGLIPLRMASSVLGMGLLMDDWNLSEAGQGEWRRYTSHVSFDLPFANTPLVQVGLSGFDIDNRSSARLNLSAAEITPFGFDVVLETWRDTCVYSAQVSWLALGQ